MSLLDKMKEQRAALLKQAMDIAERAAASDDGMSGEEATSFDALMGNITALDERSKSIIDSEQRERDITESLGKLGRGGVGDNENRGAFGLWARESRAGDVYDIAPEVRDHHFDSRELLVATRDMSGTAGLGPQSVYTQLWSYAVAASQILQAGVTFIDTTDGNTIPLPVVTAHANASASAAANAPLTASDSALGTVNLGAVKQQFYTNVPNELLSDATFDVEGYIARNAGRALGEEIAEIAEAALIAGFTTSGATAPTASIGAATGSVFSDAIISLFWSVLGSYRTNGSWLGNDQALAAISKAKDGLGSYAFPGLVMGDLSIFRKPVFSGVTLPAPTGTNKPLYFGDFSAIAVRRAGGLRFERSVDAGFTKDQTVYRAIVRTAAVAVDPNAIKLLALTAA